MCSKHIVTTCNTSYYTRLYHIPGITDYLNGNDWLRFFTVSL